ncbi:hypothetical protein E1200_32890, partial [Actinomadura sp. GC306]
MTRDERGPAGGAPGDPAADSAADSAGGLAAELAELGADAPAGLLDRIAARRVRVPGPLPGRFADLQVAFTDRGVAYLRAGMEEAEFAAAFRARFARPLLPGAAAPEGLAAALRDGRPGALRLDLRGLGEFEAAVLAAAARIPRGQVRPYAWV